MSMGENDDDRPGLADEIYINHHHDLSAVACIPTLAVRYGYGTRRGRCVLVLQNAMFRISRARCSVCSPSHRNKEKRFAILFISFLISSPFPTDTEISNKAGTN